MKRRIILLALDSVGIDPQGHDRPGSVYQHSRFLFPPGEPAGCLTIANSPVPGVLVETDVTSGCDRGSIECALTYTSIFSGESAVDRHGLMRALGLKESVLKEMIARGNLFRCFDRPCLLNAIFPVHLPFLGTSFVQDLVPLCDRKSVETGLQFRSRPVCFKGKAEKNGFAELFTLAEINQNIFVHAAREAGVTLRSWEDVRRRRALTATMTHELEAEFNVDLFGQAPLPVLSPREAAGVLLEAAHDHDFLFWKYQVPDLVSHTGRVESARQVFAVIEEFVETILESIDPARTTVIITSDHGHLEQVETSHHHPKTRVPTWYFGPEAERMVDRLRRPEGIHHVAVEAAKIALSC
jgi:hypothetical protein